MSLTTTNDTTSPGPEPLTSLDVAKDTAAINDNINSWKIKPAISFPENYNTVKANTNTPENDDNKSPFLQLVPNVDPDTKIYANTPTYYQPKDINPRYKNFILGADNEAISANKQTGLNELGNSIANFGEKAGAYIIQNIGFIAGAIPATLGGIVNLGDELTGGNGKVINNGNAISMMTDNFLVNLGDAWKESTTDRNPIYKSDRYTQGNIWQKLSTPEWWADDAVDRLALTGAMLVPGFAEGKGLGLFGAAMRTADGALETTGALAKATKFFAENPEMYGKVGKVFGNNIFKVAADGVADIDASIALKFKGIIQVAQKAELYSWNVIGQSALNGREAQVGIRKALQEQKEQGLNNLSDKEIENKAAKGAMQGFGYTLPLSLGASLYELPQIFSTAKTAESLLEKNFSMGAMDMTENALTPARPGFGKLIGKTLATGFEHGQNESAQVAIGRYIEESIAGKTKDQKTSIDERNPFIAIFKNWIDNVNDPNGQNNIALGTIQGMLMTGFGHAKAVKNGEYTATDDRNKNFIQTINEAKARRRFFTTPEDFYQKGENNSIELTDDYKPKFNPDRLGETGMSLIHAQDQREQWSEALKNKDYSKMEDLRFNSLASLAQNFFDDPKGMEYFTNFLKFEEKNQTQSLDRINDTINGQEITPAIQLQQSLDTANKLKRAYDAIEQRHAGFTSLEYDKNNKNEVRARNNYVRDFQNAQYYNAADQIHLENKLNKRREEVTSLGSAGHLIENPSSPNEEKINDLIVEGRDLEERFQSKKNAYKVLIDKDQFRKGFDLYKNQGQATKDLINDIKANANVRIQSITIPQTDSIDPTKTIDTNLNLRQEYSLREPLHREDNTLIISPKITPTSGLFGGVHQVILPSGKTSYLTPGEIRRYNALGISPKITPTSGLFGGVHQVILPSGKTYYLSPEEIRRYNAWRISPKITTTSGLFGGVHQVILPSGKTSYLSPEELGRYNISEVSNDSPAFSKIMNNTIDNVLKKPEFKEIDKPLIGQDKLTYVNSLNNPELISDIEKDFKEQTKDYTEQLAKQQEQQQQLAKNKEAIDKAQTELELNSGTVNLNNASSDIPSDPEAKIIDANIFFQSGITESEDYNDPKSSAQHVKNSREFLNNIDSFPNRGDMRIILITPGQEKNAGLVGLSKMSYGDSDSSEILDPENGFIGQVFVIQEGGKTFYINKEGKKLGEFGTQLSEEDLKNVIFQPMRTTKTTDSIGKPRFRENQQELFEAYKEQYIKFRQELNSQDGKTPTPYKFTVSIGIPIENEINGIKEKNHVGGILVDKNLISTKSGLITIPTTGTVSHNGKLISFPNGVPVLENGATLEKLNNRNFTNKEANTIYQVVKALATRILEQSASKEGIRLDKDYITYLQNLLYWRKETTTTSNQININTDKMTIQIGGKSYLISDIINSEKEIVTDLLDKKTYHAINNNLLEKDLSTPFEQYILNKEGELNEEPVVWKNYQTYLLSDENPDGTKRSPEDTPLTTSVSAPSISEIGVPYSFKQRYATIEGADFHISLPIKETSPITENVPSEEKIGDYIIDDKTINVFKLSGDRPVNFISSFDENGTVTVSIESNETTKALSINKTANGEKVVDSIIIPALKNIQKEKGEEFNDTKTDEEYVFDYLANIIASDLQNKKEVQTNIKVPKEEIKKVDAQSINIEVERKKDLKGIKPIEEIQSNNKAKGVIPKSDGKAKGVIPKDDKNPSNLPEYRKVGMDSKDMMTDTEIQLFKSWVEKNVPNIPYEILNNIITTHIGEKAWGVFENGIAKFVKGGLRGTEYHEIFEGIYKGMLSKEEQQALLDEFKSKTGTFKDRISGKSINYSDATDLQAKERIADDFADYRVGKLPARSLGEAVRNFFKRIMDFFKTFVSVPSLKEELFKAIDTGKFKNKILSEESKNNYTEYRALEGLGERDSREFVDDMVARSINMLFAEGQKGLLFTPNSITGDEMFSKIETQYAQEFYSNGFSKRDVLSDLALQQLKEKTIDRLRTLGVNFDIDNQPSINDDNTNKNDYAPEAFKSDVKKSAPQAIKLLIVSLLKTVATNQENNLSFKMPKPQVSNIGGFKLLGYSRAFATILDKISNTSSISKMVDKLSELANDDSDYVRLFKNLGGKISDRQVDFTQFNNDDWRLFIEFAQTFAKQKPDALVQYKDGTEVYTAPANQFTANKQIQQSWLENIKTLATSDSELIKFDKLSKTYKIAIDKIKELPINNVNDQLSFLNKIGIDLDINFFSKLKENQVKTFNYDVSGLKQHFGSTENIMTINGELLGSITGRLASLAELYNTVTNPNMESTHYSVEGEKRGAFAENNTPSVFENEFNECKTLDELLKTRPELNDLYNKGSQVLKPGGLFFDKERNRIKEMKVSYIDGTKLLDDNKGTSTTKLTLGERFTQEINQNVDGNYYILIPADGSTEWMMNMGNNIKFSKIETGKADSTINETFRGYLLDDINLALDYKNREHLKAVGDKAKELRFFKDILSYEDGTPSQILKDINKMIELGNTENQFKEYINTPENLTKINSAIQLYIDGTVTETRKILEDNKQILLNEENEYSYMGLSDKFLKDENIDKSKLSDKIINDILKFINVNYIINNIEYHKVIFGDPFQFTVKKDGTLDETKRIKSFLSPRRTTFDSPEFNSFLNINKNKANNIQLKPGDPGYLEFKSYTETVTLKDNIISGSLSNIMYEYGNKSAAKAYAKNDESDASSVLMPETYREIKIKNRQWTDDAEEWHQWQMAYTRQNYPGYKYTNTKLKGQDEVLVKTKEPSHHIEILKPIISGYKYDSMKMELVLDKLSQMPIYYSMVKDTSLGKLYEQMHEQGIGYAIVESGRKVGQAQAHSLYTPNGLVNEEAFNDNTIVKVPWKAYGIQVETTTEGEKTQTRGSQLTKGASADLYENGEVIGATPERKAEIHAEYIRNTNLLNEMHSHGYNSLLNRLGIIDSGEGYHTIKDGKAVSSILMREMLRRQLSDNTKESLQLDSDNQFLIPFEASPSYIQIRNILYSLIDKTLGSPSMSGGAHVQVPITGFESALEGRRLAIKTTEGWKEISRERYEMLSTDDKKKVMLTDDTLKFYTKEHPYCEVMLPFWFKSKLGIHANKTDVELIDYLNSSEEGKNILKGIGFRIPTQALSSIECFKVKGFLPQYMGATVVVPSEITTKSGSDFDIDKLNMYLKSIYIDKTGNIRLIKYHGSEEATKSFYRDMFDRGELLSKEHQTELKKILELNKDSGHVDSLIKSIFGEEGVFSEEDIIGDFTQDLAEQGIKTTLINEMYKKALENEYYDSLEKLITLPENFERLITPIGDAGLEDLSKELDDLRGYDETQIKNRILDRNYLTSMRNSFVTGKRWVGIAAVNITNLSLKQKSKVYIDTTQFAKQSIQDKKYLGDGSILLNHNTVIVDGQERISLSGITVKDSKELISQRLSGYATAFVDIAKGDYITKIIQSDLIIGTFMFLENIGVGAKTAMFLNQPIISEYLKYLNSINAKTLFDRTNIEKIKDTFSTTQDHLHNKRAEIDIVKFEENIKNYSGYKIGFHGEGSPSDMENAIQHKILDEFLKYAKMAEFNFAFTQATNYDTTTFRSIEGMDRKIGKTTYAQENNIISSVDNILSSTFIGKQREFMGKSMNALSTVLKLDQPVFKNITQEVLKPFAENKYMSEDIYEKIAVQVKSAFIDYVVQTKTQINERINELLVDPKTCVALQLEKAKIEYPDMDILKELIIDSGIRINGAKTIKLRVKSVDAIDDDMYTGMMRELRDNPSTNQLYKDIVDLSIIQGTYSSAISIRNIIPIEDYSKIVSPIINTMVANKSFDAFKQGSFQKNNFKDNDIIPYVDKVTFEESKKPIARTPEGDIYSYTSPLFSTIDGLDIKANDRKLLFLSEKWNFKNIGNEFVKIPRLVPFGKENAKIDMITGTIITPRDFAKMKEKGDQSLKDIFGYQRVRHEVTGEPLIQKKLTENGIENIHVYKLVNLLGDGDRATENYEFNKSSVIDNGTIKIDNEIPNKDIFENFDQEYEKEDVSLPEEINNVTDNIKEILTNSGKTIESLGIKEEEWNSLLEEEKEKIKNCN